MRKMSWKALCILTLLAGLGALTFQTGGRAQQMGQEAGVLTVMTWNLGYGGLGADADFLADGGRMLRAPSREAAERNVAAIAAHLAAAEADAILLQEAAEASWPNRRVDLLAAIRAARPQDHLAFTSTARVRGPFDLKRASVGLATLTPSAPARAGTLDLESPFAWAALFARQTYRAQIAELADRGGARWVLINVHLSAFDEDAELRTRQLRAVLAAAEAEQARGAHVVVGGDFNLTLAETDFPHTTEEKHLFWLHPFPMDALPDGWRVVADSRAPSVRTNERPYRRGENYRGVIDGFIVSPGVDVLSVDAADLDFRNTDHNPVTARFRALP